MERKTIIFQWLGKGVNQSITNNIKGYDFIGNMSWRWADWDIRKVMHIGSDIAIPVPGTDSRRCRVGDYVIISPDGSYFQDLKYLQKYEKSYNNIPVE